MVDRFLARIASPSIARTPEIAAWFPIRWGAPLPGSDWLARKPASGTTRHKRGLKEPLPTSTV